MAQERSKAAMRQAQAWWERETVQQELGLSDAQVAAIAQIDEQNRPLVRKNMVAQQKAYRELIKLLTLESPSEEEIAARREVLEIAWVESIRQIVAHMTQLRNELTTEQWQKMPHVAPRALQLGGFRTRGMGTVTVEEKT